MEGRTKFNYGMKDNILSIKDVNYMFSIINSDLSDSEKATKLYAFCNYYTICYSLDKYKELGLIEVERLEVLKMIYDDYDDKGYFVFSKNPYKCTLAEIEVRLIKLNDAMNIIATNDSDYTKAENLLVLYSNSKSLRKSYSLFIKFGKNDKRLDFARDALNNFDIILKTFIEYEEKGIIDNIKYLTNIKDYLENYSYAIFAVSHYITSQESYKEKEFLKELGIDKETFDFCVQTVEELNVDIFKQYEVKKEQNNKIRYMHNIATIKDLANGIITGFLSDGKPFDMFEFLKRVPFKYSKNFLFSIGEFMKRNTPLEHDVIMSYIDENKLHSFSPLDIKAIYQVKIVINGIEITNDDNDVIIDYLKINNIPIINKSYILARTKYINGDFTKETVREQRKQFYHDRNKVKILIPNGGNYL